MLELRNNTINNPRLIDRIVIHMKWLKIDLTFDKYNAMAAVQYELII